LRPQVGVEKHNMVSQNAIPSKQHLDVSLPYVFSGQGVAAISAVLASERVTGKDRFQVIKFMKELEADGVKMRKNGRNSYYCI